MAIENQVGARIRRLREEKELTAEQLAEVSQCPHELIEDLESGELAPSLAPLMKIARGLGVHLGELLDDEPQCGPVVTRSGNFDQVVRFSGIGPATRFSTLDFYALAPNKEGRHMEPFIIDVHPTVPEECMLSSHEGEEFIYVMSGAIEVTYGKDIIRLSQGDSIYYDSVVPHEVRAAGEVDARILAVVYCPF